MGTIQPDSNSNLIYFYNSSNSKVNMGYNLHFFCYTLGSINGMVNGVQFLVIVYTGSAKIYGWAAFSSFKSSCEPSNFASCACPLWADQCVKLRLPTCSTNARYAVDTRAILSNYLADTHSQARADSNTIALPRTNTDATMPTD